eukprot:1923987-Rhodomonas_salina.2
MGCGSSTLPLEECYGLTIAQADVSGRKIALHFANAGGTLTIKSYLTGYLESICGGHPNPDGTFPRVDENGTPELPELFGVGGISLTKRPEQGAFPVLQEMLQGRSVTKIEKPKSTISTRKSTRCLISFSATAAGTPVQNPDIRWAPRPDGVGVYREQPMSLSIRFRVTANQSSSTERSVDDYEVEFKPAK